MFIRGFYEVDEMVVAEQFVGNNFKYYKKRFRDARKGDVFLGINLAALFFGPSWLVYRKMPVQFFIFASFVVPIKVMLSKYLSVVLVQNLSVLLYFLVSHIGLSVMGNYIYYRHFKKVLSGVKSQVHDVGSLMENMKEKGGTIIKPY